MPLVSIPVEARAVELGVVTGAVGATGSMHSPASPLHAGEQEAASVDQWIKSGLEKQSATPPP